MLSPMVMVMVDLLVACFSVNFPVSMMSMINTHTLSCKDFNTKWFTFVLKIQISKVIHTILDRG